jgi:hypothetical protein
MEELKYIAASVGAVCIIVPNNKEYIDRVYFKYLYNHIEKNENIILFFMNHKSKDIFSIDFKIWQEKKGKPFLSLDNAISVFNKGKLRGYRCEFLWIIEDLKRSK